MKQTKIAFMGAGNIATSMVAGLINNQFSAENIWVTSPTEDHLNMMEQRFNVKTTKQNAEAVHQAEVIILAVKPPMVKEVMKEIADALDTSHSKLIISVATGITMEKISEPLKKPAPVIRAMPNIAGAVGASATAMVANHHVSEVQKNLAESILQAIGAVVWLEEENLIDVVTALSGSGPAYFFYMMEGMIAAGIKEGLDPKVAEFLTIQTCFGAAKIALESQSELAELRARVTVPGGTTAAATEVLMHYQLHEIFAEAIDAAKQKAIELSKK